MSRGDARVSNSLFTGKIHPDLTAGTGPQPGLAATLAGDCGLTGVDESPSKMTSGDLRRTCSALTAKAGEWTSPKTLSAPARSMASP